MQKNSSTNHQQKNMEPNVQWMGRNFDLNNNKYFQGKLPRPKFEAHSCIDDEGNDCFGVYDLRFHYNGRGRIDDIYNGNGVLILNSDYGRPETAWTRTLLHEMIHEMIYIVERVYEQNPHGNEFMKWANWINRDGWGISEFDEEVGIKGDEGDTDVNNWNVKPSLLCIADAPQRQDFKCWIFHSDEANLKASINVAKKIPGIDSVRVFQCWSVGLDNLKIDPNALWGYGGKDLQDAVSKLVKWSSAYDEDFDIKKLKLIYTY